MSVGALARKAMAEEITPEHYPLYEGLYRHVLDPSLHERQMRAAYLRVYITALRMGLAEVAARHHARRTERQIDADVRSGRRPPFGAVVREDGSPSLVLGR